MTISKPDASEYSPYYDQYVQLVKDDDLLIALKNAANNLMEVVRAIPEEKADYRYEPGKWSIKEVLAHLNDAERVFAYRALRFARNDKTELAGFDENLWVPQSNAMSRSLKDIISEHEYIRQSSLSLFESMSEEMSLRKGSANGKEISVRALGYIICGHATHHVKVLQERYLG